MFNSKHSKHSKSKNNTRNFGDINCDLDLDKSFDQQFQPVKKLRNSSLKPSRKEHKKSGEEGKQIVDIRIQSSLSGNSHRPVSKKDQIDQAFSPDIQYFNYLKKQ